LAALERFLMFFAVVLTAALPLSTAAISSGVPSRRTVLARFTLFGLTFSIPAAFGTVMGQPCRFAGLPATARAIFAATMALWLSFRCLRCRFLETT
jgi:hypothetical protein